MGNDMETMDHNKLNTSELSRILKNVSRNYLRPGVQNKFNECKHYIQTHGLDSINNLRPTFAKIDRQEIKNQISKTILQLGLEHPYWTSDQIRDELKLKNIDISNSAVYNILSKYQMGTRYERLQKLVEQFSENLGELSAEQVKALEKFDPGFKERNMRGKKPGALLAQDTVFVGVNQTLGEIYMQVVVDSYSNYAFGFVHIRINPDHAVTIIHNEVIPFFKDIESPVSAILTDNGREFCGKENHHYELYLKLNDIQHIRIVKKQNSNNFLKRFVKIITDDFINRLEPEKLNDKIEAIQSELTDWLYYYNRQRPCHGFPNIGRPPILLIQAIL